MFITLLLLVVPQSVLRYDDLTKDARDKSGGTSFLGQPLLLEIQTSQLRNWKNWLILLALNPASLHHTYSCIRASRKNSKILTDIHPADAQGQVGTQSLSCCLSASVRKPTRVWAVSCSSAYVLRTESCQGTCQRSTPKTSLFLVCQQALLVQL